jgi:hypothetical protein
VIGFVFASGDDLAPLCIAAGLNSINYDSCDR